MNTQSPILLWLVGLGNTLKLVIQFPARFFQFIRRTSSFEKKENIPMKIQEQFMSRLSNVINRIRNASWTRRPKSRGQLLMRVLVLVVVLALAVVPFWRVFAYSFIVNSTADRVDSNPGDGICRTSANTCTLRAAIQEANASPGLDDIYVPAGVYAITIPPMNDNFIDNGDFDITDSLRIDGAGAGTTILDGGTPPFGSPPVVRGLDRLIEIHPGVDEVVITGLTIREGYSAESGGGIQFGSELVDVSGMPVPVTGTLRLENVSVIDNYAAKYGGGVNSTGRGLLQVVASTLTGNGATEGGAAINNASAGTVEILDGSLIYENPGPVMPDPTDPEGIILVNPSDYPLGPGAVNNQAENDLIGTIRVVDSTIRNNAAMASGAGIHNTRDGAIIVENSTISGNISEANGGGIYTTSGDVTILGSTFSGNKAAEGGAMYSDGELTKAGLPNHLEVTNSTVSGNVATANGGGIVSGGETFFTMTNVDVIDNQAHAQGGGVINRGRSSLDVIGGVFSGNEAAEDGGALLVQSERETTITETVFTNNHAGVLTLTEDPILGETAGGGGGLYTDGMGAVVVTDATFEENTAYGQGGAISIHSFGNVTISNTLVNNNQALGEDGTGGGIENSAALVIFERLTVTNNSATSDGGGIHNSSSGEFTVLDSTINDNEALNGGGFTNASDSTLVIRRTLFWNNQAKLGFGEGAEETGFGGGLYSISDGGGLIENSTFSGNTADTKGGGIYNNADGALRVVNATIWRNSAPSGGGVAVMSSDAVPTIPPTPPTGLILRNSIVSGSIQGGGCDGAVRSEGGNIDEGSVCFTYTPTSSDIVPIGDRMNTTPELDALADNGGYTLTHAFSSGESIGIDGGVSTVTNTAGVVMPACPETDARGVTRPQHLACDVGAYEHDGPLGPPDTEDPDTEFTNMATDDSTGEQLLFYFRGTDNMTAPNELTFQCRLLEFDPTEPVEPVAPGEPLPIELQFRSCSSPYAVPAVEAGLFTFEVFAIDRAGNDDDTPAVHIFTMNDLNPPETLIVEYPPSTTTSHNATFTFSAIDDFTPPNLHEFECRLDSLDPELWLECLNPTVFSDLAPGEHTLFVRATDLSDNVDPSPAIWTWTVTEPTSCDESNINLIAVADGWVDEVNPAEAYPAMTELEVRSGLQGTAPGNARAFYRFSVPTEAAGCALESATLRLYSGGGTAGRTIEAIPVAGPWSESNLTWNNQPATTGTASSVIATGTDGYMEWDVLSQVDAGIVSYGFMLRDAVESDPEGSDQSFLSRETFQDPPPVTLPQLVLRYEAAGDPAPEPPAQPTVPTVVSCGQVITESTLVANDLVGCMGEGLVIGAPNIMLDLNGHSITSGVIVQLGQETGLLAGVRNSGHANVVIKNGTIKNFGYGVQLLGGAKYNVVEGMILDGNWLAGIELFDADDGRNGNTIRDNYFTRNGENALSLIRGSENSVILNNTFEGNGGVAIFVEESNGHLIEGNTIDGISADPLIGADAGIMLISSSDNVLLNNSLSETGDAGLLLDTGSNRNRIEGNTVVGGSDAGISINNSNGNEIINNIAHQNGGAGISLHGDNSVLRGNDVRFNPGGIELGGSNNLIENNNISFTKSNGLSIEVGLGNQILNNTANDNLGTGIAVETDALDALGNPIPGNTIEGNTANGNLGDGISAGGGHLIKDNNAHNNLGFGIFGADGVVDGGSNMASGNAEAVQCVNVVCTSTGNVPLTQPDIVPPDTFFTETPPVLSTSVSAIFRFSGVDDIVPATALIFECRLDPPADPPLPEPEPTEPPTPPQPGETPTTPEPPEVIDPTNPESWTECLSPTYYLSLEAGTHHLEVRAYDQSGNFDLTPATFDWIIEPMPDGSGPDTIAPNTSLREFPSNPSTSSTATFAFVGSDNSTPGPYLEFQCQIDGGGFLSCSSPQTYTDLELGEHTFEVAAIDRSGNVDLSPATYTWTIVAPVSDTTAPGTLILSAPDQVTVDTSATFTFSSTETGSAFECSLDGGAFTTCTSPISYTGLSVDSHTFEVYATDAAGNADLSPALHTWTIGPAPVSATVFCGQTVTQSIKVLNDLVDCPVYGLVVGADNITIDLNGRIINGVGLGIGILNRGYDSVTITNGTIQEFDNGIQLDPGSSNNIIAGMTLELNQVAGILLRDADNDSLLSGAGGNIIRNNNIINNDLGIALDQDTQGAQVHNNELGGNTEHAVYIQSSSANRVEDNLISESTGVGVLMVGASYNTVIGNTLLTNDGGGIVVEAGIPFVIEASIPAEFEPPDPPIEPEIGIASNNNRVENNILENGGILVIGSNNTRIVNNSVQESEFGIRMETAHNSLLLNNNVRGNSAGIALYGSTGNRLEANNASEITGSGIALQSFSLNNQLVLNTASFNDSDGISVSDAAVGGAGNLLDRNTTYNNGNNGIYVAYTGHTLVGNIANDNGNWGIYAAAGAGSQINIDGGGNLAADNVQLEQCFGIVCNSDGPGTLDAVPPETLILEGPASPTTNASAQFRFTGTDNISTVEFQCRLDSALETDFADCSSPHLYSGLSVGTHTFEVRAVDSAGNADASPAVYTWTIDTLPAGVAPETTIDSGPDLTTVSTSATFSFSSNEPGVTFACSLDGAPFTSCAAPAEYSGLTVGAHQFQVQATDAESLTDPTPATYNWTITAAPVATSVACGQLLTQSTLVTNDLFDCPGNALIVGASNITIDLNGHTIDGVGLGSGILNPQFDSVTITNGTMREFDYGVELRPGSLNNVVSNLTVTTNQIAGIALSDADNATVRSNIVTLNPLGIVLYAGTSGALVSGNDVTTNAGDGIRLEFALNNRIEDNTAGMNDGFGIVIEGAGGNTITGNVLNLNVGGGITIGATTLPSNDNLVQSNVLTGNVGAGILVTDSSGNDVLDNVSNGSNGAGVALELSSNTLIRGNDVRFNGVGIELSQSSNNRIEFNDASGNTGSGITIDELSFNNEVVMNIVSVNGGDGIEVIGSAPAGQGNLIEGNTANGNGGDGIFVDGAGHTLNNNVANYNAGWGMYVPLGATNTSNRAVGNVEPSQCFGIVCDTSGIVPGAPDTVIMDHPLAVTDSRNARFTYTGVDDTTPLGSLIFECRLDSTNDLAWVDCEYPADYFNLAPGMHTFEVRAVDIGLLADQTPASFTWEYVPPPSGVAPDTFIDIAPEPVTPLFEALFTFTSNEPDVAFQCQVDDLPWVGCGPELDLMFAGYSFYLAQFEDFQIGPHTFQVRAIDIEGNIDPTPATHTWSILGGPITTIESGPAFIPPAAPGEPPSGGESESTSATFTFTSYNEPDSTFYCSLDLAPYALCDATVTGDLWSVTYTNLTLGEHIFTVYAVSPEGVEELEPIEYSWEVIVPLVNNPPDTVITFAPANNSSDTVFEFTGTDDFTPTSLLTYECRLDVAPFEGCLIPFNILELYPVEAFLPGEHTFEVRAIDDSDPTPNIDPTPASYTWTTIADTIEPNSAFLSGPSSPTLLLEAEFTFLASDNATPELMLELQCSLDGGLWEPCSSPLSLNFQSGAHTLQVRSVDLAQNVETTPASWSWSSALDTTIETGPVTLTSEATASFSFVSNDPLAPFECSLDGAPFVACESGILYETIDYGAHEFQVRSVSQTAGMDTTPAVWLWTRELETVISSGPNTFTFDTFGTFDFVASDPLASFECSLNGSPFTACASPASYDVEIGLHNFQVRAVLPTVTDSTPASWTWSRMVQTTILSAPLELAGSTTVTFTFSANVPDATFECWMDGVIAACSSPMEYTGLSLGTHFFAVRAATPAGPFGNYWTDHEFTIVPATTITSGPDLTTESTSATFTFVSEASGVGFVCSLDGGDVLPCTSPVTYENLLSGAHVFTVQAIDPVTGMEMVPVTYAWTILDNTAPDTFIDLEPENPSDSTTATFAFSASEPNVNYQCSLNGAAFDVCDSPYILEGLALGNYTLAVRAVDFAGLVDQSPATFAWEVVADTTAPNTSIISGPTAVIGTDFTVISFSGSDTGTLAAELTFECSLDNGVTWEACSSPYEIQDLAPTSYTFQVRATDLAGNVDLTPATRSWEVVLTVPTGFNVLVEIPMPGGVLLDPASLTFTQVTSSGMVSLDVLVSPPALPAGYFQLGSVYYDLSTTAGYAGSIYICLGFNPADFSDPANVHLLHYEGGAWVDVTAEVDPTGTVCGEVSSLSPFAVVEVDPNNAPTNDPEPDTFITAGPPSQTSNYIATFQFTGQDNNTPALDLEFQCTLDGAALGSCSSPADIEVLSDGSHTFTVAAVDVDGNIDPTPASHTWTIVDFTAPDTSIDLGPSSEATETTATFEFSAVLDVAEAGVTFECSLDGADFAACTSPYTLAGLSNGAHYFLVRAIDVAGNADPTPDIYEWVINAAVDTTAPDTTITYLGTLPTAPGDPQIDLFALTSDEAGAVFECSLDGAAFEGCEAALELEGLSAGSHTLQARAIDLAVNVDATPASFIWSVGGTPETVIVSGPASPSADPIASFLFSANQAGVAFLCSLDGGEAINCPSPYLVVVSVEPVEGIHTLEVQAVSALGAVDETPAVYTWTIGLPPETTITSGPPVAVAPETIVTFYFTGVDDYSPVLELDFECSLDGAAFNGCSSPLELDGLAQGDHVLLVRAVDLADHVDPTPASYQWAVHLSPDTAVLTGPALETDSTEATFTFSSTIAGSTFECSLDGAPFAACASPVTYTSVPFGLHLFEVRAVSPEGVMDIDPAQYEWASGDLTPPVTTITTDTPAAPATISETTATFNFTADEAGVTFQCSLDGALFSICVSPATYTDLAAGNHTLEVQATHQNLIVEPLPAVYEWIVVDVTAPETTIVSGPAAEIGQLTPSVFVFSSNETDATFECSLDGGAFEACAAPPNNTAELTGLVAGPHTVQVRAVDPSLNADPTPASYSWMVVGPPLTTITSGPPVSPATTSDTTATFEFTSSQTGVTFACALDGGDFLPCVSPATYSDQTYASHTFEVQATNIFGLVEEPPASYGWTIVMPPPAIAPDTLLAEPLPANPTTATSAAFSFSSDMAGATFQCSLDGSAFADCASPVQYTGLAQGEHTFQVRAVFEGIHDDTPAIHIWTVNLPPETTIASGPDAESMSTTASFTFASNEINVSFECSLDGALFASCPSPHVFADLADGPHTLLVQARDAEGNLDPTPASHSWTVLAPPDTTIHSGPPASPDTTTSTSATFTFDSNQANSTFMCSLDELGFDPCISPMTYTDLLIGDHTFEVQATNTRGQTDITPADYEWTIVAPLDTTAPETTITANPPASTTLRDASFSFSANEPGSTFQCSLDGAAFTACASPQSYSSLSYASHTFQVRATDGAGNVDASPASHTWTVTAPNCGSSITVSANADAWIDQNSSSNNYGTDSILKVQGKTGNNFRTFIRFNLPTAPAGCVVQSATLRMYQPSWTSGRTLQVLRVNASWTENGVSWANQPATTGTAVTTTSGSGYRSWNVLTLVQAMYSSSNFGFLLRDASESGGGAEQQFHSREKGESMPQLIITFAPAP